MNYAQLHEAIRERGLRMSESDERLPDGSRYRDWFKGERGNMPDEIRAVTAYLMEVQHRWMGGLAEETRSQFIGSFEKYVFPMVRAVMPNLVAPELVTVQPMQGPISLIFYMDFRAGSAKGQTAYGADLINARTGVQPSTSFTGEDVNGETVGTTAAATASNQHLQQFPVRPMSVVIVVGDGGDTQTWTDDGVGNLAANNSGTGTIDYATGTFSLAGIAGPNQADAILASYRYNSEGSQQLPQGDLVITSIPVTAKPRKGRVRWTVEAAAAMRSVHGLDAEQEATAYMSEELRFDTDREIVNDLFGLAQVPDPDPENDPTGPHQYTFYDDPPSSNISYFEHQMTFPKVLIEHGNNMFYKTRRATGNAVVCGVDVATVIENLPQFKPAATSGSGVVFMGELMGRWRIYKDPYVARDEFLLVHKGTSTSDIGYIWAPWIPVYFTPTVYLDDMVGRKGILTEYAKKPVNALFYSKGKVVHGAKPTV